MNKIFQESGIVDITTGKQKARISVGGKNLTMCLLTGLEGAQPYRTQIDVALDQTTYTLGAGKGLGSNTFGLIDGPFECLADADTALQKLEDIKSLKERKVKITLKHGRGSIQFEGLLTKFSFALSDEMTQGSYYILTAIEAVGVWK